mgnify:CR=1 FL=1
MSKFLMSRTIHKVSVWWMLCVTICVVLGSVGCGEQAIPCQQYMHLGDNNPEGTSCTKDCQCNNRKFHGICEQGSCIAKKRETCLDPRKTRRCTPLNASRCVRGEGVQQCFPSYLKSPLWGDCECAGPTPSDKEKTFPQPDAGSSPDKTRPETATPREHIPADCRLQPTKAGCPCPTPGKSVTCYPGPAKTLNKGACKAGVRFCQNTGLWSACSGHIIPKKEECSGKDDDCNGQVDDLPPLSCSLKACKKTVPACQGGRPNTCKLDPIKKEVCNGKDDDCNGKIDDLPPIHCGLGVCKVTTVACKDGRPKVCLPIDNKSAEFCNGKDDDCNGKVDDLPALSCGVGPCKTTVPRCLNGKDNKCTPKSGKKESCNGVDDDCNGVIDDMPKLSCGQGICRTSVPACKGGKPNICTTKNNTLEVCNGKDDDCNGKIDDNIPLSMRPACSNQKGVCWGAKASPNSCVRGKWLGCTQLDYVKHSRDYAKDDRSCDFLDSDCDGKVDEDAVMCVTAFSGAPMHRDGVASLAAFNRPEGLAFDKAGNLFIADTRNHRIRKLDTGGKVTTIAGTGAPGFQDGSVYQAKFNRPTHLAVDSKGNVFVFDSLNFRIRKIDTAGKVTTVIGTGVKGSKDGPGVNATVSFPQSMAFDARDNLYFGDFTRIRKYDAKGIVTNFAGIGTPGYRLGLRLQARFRSISGLTYRATDDSLYFAEGGSKRILKLSLSSEQVQSYLGPFKSWNPIYSLAFAGNALYSLDSSGLKRVGLSFQKVISASFIDPFIDGSTSSANFNIPKQMVSKGSDLYIVDGGQSNRVRKYDTKLKTLTSIVGIPFTGAPSTTTSEFLLHYPRSVHRSSSGQLYVSDAHRILKVDDKGKLSIFVGTTIRGTVDGKGINARFYFPIGLTSDKAGNLYAANGSVFNIRKIAKDGTVTTFAGTGQPGNKDGPMHTATFSWIQALVFDKQGNLFVAEPYTIRKIDTKGQVSTFVGGKTGFKDGIGKVAQFGYLRNMVIDSKGNLFVTDQNNHRIRKITPAGVVTTYAGTGVKGDKDGPGNQATIGLPIGLAIDQLDNLYVTTPSKIRKITPNGVVTTLNKNSYQREMTGPVCDVELLNAFSIATDGKNLYIPMLLGQLYKVRLQP